MSRRWILILSALSLVFAGLLLLLAQRLSMPVEEEITAKPSRKESPSADQAEMPNISLNVDDDEIEEEKGGVPEPEWGEDAIPGEHVLIFSDRDSMEAFVDAAEERGIVVADRIGNISAVRVMGEFGQFKDLLGEDVDVGNNYEVRHPSLPDPNALSAENLKPFNEKVLEFLGIEDVRSISEWGKGTRIAVLDTRISEHPLLQGKVLKQINMLQNRSGNGELGGHGTAVAGLIASSEPFAPGVAPGSEIVGIQVLDGEGKGNSFTLAKGIYQAVAEGANVINTSLGTYGSSKVVESAVKYAVNRGVVVVAASGNDGRGQVTYPAAYEDVIGVTAVDAGAERAPFSNFGEGVDLAAPGYQLHSLWSDSEYVYFGGTSASAPIVSSVAAQMVSSGMSVEDVREVLTKYSNDVGMPGEDPEYGQGVLNVKRILERDTSGIHDLALADLHPATSEESGGTFPLYVSLQNRGTEYLPQAKVELDVDGQKYFYNFSGLNVSDVDSVQIPVSMGKLNGGGTVNVSAKVVLPEGYEDHDISNDEGMITLKKKPEEEE